MPKKTFSGTVEVCAHRVSFWYDLEGHRLSSRLEIALTDAAEARAKECIIEGCVAGELNCYYVFNNKKDAEIRGWWEIKRD